MPHRRTHPAAGPGWDSIAPTPTAADMSKHGFPYRTIPCYEQLGPSRAARRPTSSIGRSEGRGKRPEPIDRWSARLIPPTLPHKYNRCTMHAFCRAPAHHSPTAVAQEFSVLSLVVATSPNESLFLFCAFIRLCRIQRRPQTGQLRVDVPSCKPPGRDGVDCARK